MKNIVYFLLFVAFYADAQKIYTTTNLSLAPLIEGGSVVKLGVGLGSIAPTGDVTVSFTSQNGYFSAPGSLTFTTGNFATAQSVNLAASNNSVADGIRYDYLNISATGGGYSHTKKMKVQVIDSYIDSSFLRGWPNYSQNVTTLSSLRSAMLTEIWNGNGLPSTAMPDTLVAGWTGTMHQTSYTTLSGLGVTVDKLVYDKVDNQGYKWTSRVYHVMKNGGSHNKVCLVSGGHGSEAYHLQMIQDLIGADVDVLYVALPSTQDNREFNPGVGSIGVGAHNDILTSGLDNGTYNPLELFFYDKIKAINWVDSVYSSYNTFYATGCSGGGWTALFLGAMDTRISKTFEIRGFTAWQNMLAASNVDYEQGPYVSTTNFDMASGFSSVQLKDNYKAVNYFDVCMLACSGGRQLHMIHHYDDSCCHKSFVYNLFYPRLKKDAADLGGTVELYMMTDPTYSAHSFNVPDRAYIISKI